MRFAKQKSHQASVSSTNCLSISNFNSSSFEPIYPKIKPPWTGGCSSVGWVAKGACLARTRCCIWFPVPHKPGTVVHSLKDRNIKSWGNDMEKFQSSLDTDCIQKQNKETKNFLTLILYLLLKIQIQSVFALKVPPVSESPKPTRAPSLAPSLMETWQRSYSVKVRVLFSQIFIKSAHINGRLPWSDFCGAPT